MYLAKLLRHIIVLLGRQWFIVKTGHERWWEAQVPTLKESKLDYSDLYDRCRKRWARKRSEVEEDIARRVAGATRTEEVLHDWE